ncbi:sulfatase [Vallitalea guaymasensis]|uniref:Sulfatase n=1 Tax=Vallitalea guaymasensis TaxID=1185412 RepID=A0A8J8SD72_9FIRM|nr:sulfatase [Vallitalea guaymasensis]QUH30429.1 sulfatase [Vallitalea guaymasensis]
MTTTSKPNIIFILIDDMGYKDLSCYESTFYETPFIDSLAHEGMLFTDGYASCPVCSPSRASIMSGKYPANIGVTDWIDHSKKCHPAHGILVDAPYIDHLPLEEISIAKALSNQSYQTWHVGKWHLGKESYYPEKHGFQVNIGGCHYGNPYNGYFSPYDIPTLENGPEGEYLTDRLTDETIKLIKNRDTSSPFYLNLCYYAVHTPIQAKENQIHKYEQKRIALGIDKEKELIVGEHFPCYHKRDEHVTRRIIQGDASYAAMIENLDWNVGRLLSTLKETGIDEDTLIIFTSDNGGLSTAEGSPTCNAPLNEGKGWMYEGGVRVPLLVRWPNVISPGTVCNEPVTSPDFYPTLLEASNSPLMPEQHQDGVSILPLLEGRDKIEREALYWHYPHYGNQGGTPGSSIRMGNYKLIEFFETGKCELYDLTKDVSEEHNLIDELPEKVSLLKDKLEKWRFKMEAKIPAAYKD